MILDSLNNWQSSKVHNVTIESSPGTVTIIPLGIYVFISRKTADNSKQYCCLMSRSERQWTAGVNVFPFEQFPCFYQCKVLETSYSNQDSCFIVEIICLAGAAQQKLI